MNFFNTLSASYKKVKFQESGLLIVIILLALFLTLASDVVKVQGVYVNNFFRLDNIIPNVATPVSWMAIMALGMSCVIIAGGIDISVGSIFGISALATAAVLQNLPENSSPFIALPIAFFVSLLVGGTAGFFNGIIITKLKMHPFIVTLGTMSILRGIALVSVTAKTLPVLGKVLPQAFSTYFIAWEMPFGGVNSLKLQPVPMMLMVAVMILFVIFFNKTPWGRKIYAVGGNEEAARFSGIDVNRTKLMVYTISGLMAGLAGMVSLGFYGAANTATGDGYELMVIASAVVGGASLTGGRGTALGAILGAIVIKLIENGIDIIKSINLGFATLSVSKEYSKIIIGAAIIIAVAVDKLSGKLNISNLLESIKVKK